MRTAASSVPSGWTTGIEPDISAPLEFDTMFGRPRVAEGERRLMMAVLEDAIACYRRRASARDWESTRMYLEACEWVASRDCSNLFSFENICDVLGIDAQCLRGRLRTFESGRAASSRRARPERRTVSAR
jgi:hypothetical protein